MRFRAKKLAAGISILCFVAAISGCSSLKDRVKKVVKEAAGTGAKTSVETPSK